MNIGDKIKFLRENNKVTQEQLSIICHTSRKTISAWENNRNKPNEEIVKKIADFFNIDSKILLDNSITSTQLSFSLNRFNIRFYILLVIHLILIVIEYLTLINLLNIFINTFLLAISTCALYYMSENYLVDKVKKGCTYFKLIYVLVIPLLNSFIGFYVLKSIYDSIQLTNGTICGKIIVILLINSAEHIFLKVVFLKRRIYMWDFIKDIFKQLR